MKPMLVPNYCVQLETIEEHWHNWLTERRKHPHDQNIKDKAFFWGYQAEAHKDKCPTCRLLSSGNYEFMQDRRY